MPAPRDVLTWLHVGDLHITAADQANTRDLHRVVARARELGPSGVDFVVLPGDNADDGTAEQFSLVRDAIAGLPMAVHILPGDHDFKPRSLDAFHRVLGADALPKSVRLRGHRCLFLDVVSAGTGGPDFRLGPHQLDWVERELDAAGTAGERVVVFMHTYPADLREGAGRLGALLTRPQVACVDMGHTHYNELANDGRTIYTATRSTGQVEEGPPGFSIGAVDGGVVSWTFHTLDAPWPLVLITSPADHRLIIDPGSPDQRVTGAVRIGAKVLGDREIVRVTASLAGGAAFDLERDERAPAYWGGSCPAVPEDGVHRLTVTAADAAGRSSEDAIDVLVDRAGTYPLPRRHGDGSDRDSIGAWPERHIFGTQLGPNRNGRAW